ncbi:energy transducer TonB [Mucilaginibacter xinganensis]|uniref:TonB C-terminal domain-containing protein n=1 Tax=Mucilaginibacter xinganensis TaxID=1234841 RepID=A0A223NYT8_9SPHI|nr:energy transducer TonB [Mucilaginibacter xinganensis]ASU35023.1 hypothetical protein MuYL_3138 [Mucilaginibacter xinganensis]
MRKVILALLLTFLIFSGADAQNVGLVYYLKNNGKLVSTKDSADYSMAVLPPDTSIDKNLYQVFEYYKNGKVRLVTNSKTNDLNLQYHGRYVAYYPTGKKRKTGEFEYGVPTGHQVEYYPNGKFYNSTNYFPDGKVLYNDCRDSTGKVLAEDGKGDWIQFNDDFSATISQGKIDSGFRAGEWRERSSDSIMFIKTYKNGLLISTNSAGGDSQGVFLPVDVVPEFPGGMPAFGGFLGKTMHYPAIARENNIQGKVIVSFVVEKDGTLTDIKVKKGIGSVCDNEAISAVRLSSPWKPALKNGRPVRAAHSVPITFTLSN